MFKQIVTRALSRLDLDRQGSASRVQSQRISGSGGPSRSASEIETATTRFAGASVARISVIGVSGSGKSKVARMAAGRLGVPYIELDAVHHGPNWTEISDTEMRRIVTDLVAGDAWVIDGNYRKVRDLVWGRATMIVWVDPSRSVVMAQVLWRSLLRAVTGQELWHGNRERMRKWIDPEHPIRWAWRTYAMQRAEHEELMARHWVRLRSREDVRRWLDSL